MKYFGTDGIRAICDQKLKDLIFNLGVVLSRDNKRIIIACDTRPDGIELAEYFYGGVSTEQVELAYAGIIPTPALAYAVSALGYDCGVMVTASHNDVKYNGVKVFDRDGYKLSREKSIEIESLLDQLSCDTFRLALPEIDPSARQAYLDKFDGSPQISIKVLVECSSGATAFVAPEIFAKYGITADFTHFSDAINDVDASLISQKMIGSDYTLGLIFDGDGDRLTAVNNEGKMLDGDSLLYALAKDSAEKLKHRFKIVASEISNGGLKISLKKYGVDVLKAKVGDANVCAKMRQKNAMMGGEPSGHIILDGRGSDAILTALEICKIYSSIDDPLRGLELLPSGKLNFDYDEKLFVALDQAAQMWRSYIGNEGNIIVRASGTEPIIRVTVECKNERLCRKILKDLGLQKGK